MRTEAAKIALALLLPALAALTLAVNWPGHLSHDSVIQLLEGRHGRYESWHPPVMAWLLGNADALVRGPGLFVAFDVVLLYGSLLLFVFSKSSVSWLGVPVAVGMAATPQFLLYSGLVWKDVLFAVSTLAGFAMLTLAGARWQMIRIRMVLLAAVAVLLALAALARQNGIAAAIMGAPAVAAIAIAQSHRWHEALAFGCAFLLALLLIVFAGSAALSLRSDRGKGRADEIKLLALYDMAGAASLDPGIRFGPLEEHDPVYARLIRTDGARLFTPERVDALFRSQALADARDAVSPLLSAQAWIDLIVRHPLLYLRQRAGIFRWVFLTPHLERCVPFLVGVSGPSAVLSALHMAPRYDARDAGLEAYANGLAGTPLFAHLTYAVLGLLAALVLWRRRRPADWAVIAMLMGAGAFALSFFVVSLACDYRYLYFVDCAALAAVFYLSLDPWKAKGGASLRRPSPV